MLWGADKAAVVVVESELDGLLLAQAAGDLAAVVALGNAQAKPDIEAHKLLQDTPLILIALDADDAGARAAWHFWPQTYGPKARRWPSILGKDASEARQKGLNVRHWIIAGAFEDEARFERFCIQTVCGGMADKEAMAEILNTSGGKENENGCKV
jgi:DNA primase